MSSKRYDIYIGCKNKYDKDKESFSDFTRRTLKKILSNIEIGFSMTSIMGGYPHGDGTYIIEDSVKITVIGDFIDSDIDTFISNIKDFYDQETVLLSVTNLDMEYR